MKTEKTSNRKEWVKNVAIIFLSVMLVLTFFSNTIMNYSLPEVATAMIEPGSITAKIRGTGNLTSDDPYKITIQESRKIASVAVKQGDVVEKDQVLFYLEDEDSAELEEAEKALNELILAYSTTILNGDISNEAYQNIQGGKVSSNGEYQNQINAAKQKVDNAQATVDSLDKQLAIAGTSTSSAVDKQRELENANTELEKAKTNLTSLQGKLADAQTQSGGDVTALTTKKHVAEEEFNDKKSAFNDGTPIPNTSSGNTIGSAGSGTDSGNNDSTDDDEADDGNNVAGSSVISILHEVKTDLQNAVNVANDLVLVEHKLQNPTVKKYEEITNINEYMAVLNTLYEHIPAADTNGTSYDDKRQALATAMHEYQQGYEVVYAAHLEYQKASKALESVITAGSQMSSLQTAVNNANNYVNECQARVNALQNEISNNKVDSDKQKESLQMQKISAEEALKNAQKELTQLLTDISSELNLGNQNSIIREQREKIAKLKENAVGAVITAPIAGTITSVNKIAGESITPNEEVAVMQPEGKGFSMSFTVTPEQAKKVTVGEQAEIQNSWYYNDIKATLVGIRPDPESNGAKKLLVFDVSGDVQAGQSVSVSIGQRSANYDLLVPNSAVREDNNGKFILIVEAKNSPLGNRYIATRVDVEVLGSDDNKTAISAPLYGYEYVITTATQPVEAGKQVRLAEN